MIRMILGITSVLVLPLYPVSATTYYVNAAQGRDTNAGTSAGNAFKTIGQAAARVTAGDTVIVGPGVYHEQVEIKASGTREKPIVFRADRIAPDRVIVSGADPAVRAGQIKWQLIDSALGLYRIPWTGAMPTRVLYSNVDLFPYRNLAALKTFEPIPQGLGPRHGYCFEPGEKSLYVRLHAGGLYGPADPNRHVMALGPAVGSGFDGTLVTKPTDWNFAVPGRRSAFVTIDGFTFETPGVCGVYVEADDVTVRNCRFFGCHSGVGGNFRDAGTAYDKYGYGPFDRTALDRYAGRIRIEQCYFTQHPAFSDAREVLLLAGASAVNYRKYFWWARKSDGNGLPDNRFKYEIGLVSRIGRDWEISRNLVEDAFEALSCHATSASENLKVHHNRFDRLIDNAVEAEDHARNMVVENNVITDVFEPISWQPLSGEPWPGPVFIRKNLIYNTVVSNGLWRYALPGRGVFKLGPSARSNWDKDKNFHMKNVSRDEVTIPAPGFVIEQNTVYAPDCRLINVIGGFKVKLKGIKFIANILLVDHWVSVKDVVPYADGRGPIEYAANLVAPATPGCLGAGTIVGGLGGRTFTTPAELGLTALTTGDFRPQPGTPAAQAQAGALLPIGKVDWYPLPPVGPQP